MIVVCEIVQDHIPICTVDGMCLVVKGSRLAGIMWTNNGDLLRLGRP